MVGKAKPAASGHGQPGNDEDDLPMYYDKGKARLIDKVLLSNKLRVGVVLFLAAVVAPVLVYAYIFDTGARTSTAYGTCNLLPEYRIPCMIGKPSDLTSCERIGCCWDDATSSCHHSIPSIFEYRVASTAGPLSFNLSPRTSTTPLGNLTKTLSCHFEPRTENHLRILIVEGDVARRDANVDLGSTAFNATVYSEGFSIEVNRTSEGADQPSLLLTTSRGPLIASDNYWELTLQLPVNGTVFGLGGLHVARSAVNPAVFYNGARSTGTHPIVVCLDKAGRAHGIYLENKGPLEIHFMKKSNLLIVRSLSNEGFLVNVFAGPTPKEVLRQLTDVIGRPKMPPYWALGLHVCRDSEVAVGVQDAVDEFLAFSAAARDLGLPFDSHCLHERLMDGLDVDVDDGDLEAVREALASLGRDGKKFLMSLPVPVAVGSSDAYTSAVKQRVLVLDADPPATAPLEGSYRDKRVGYPDWASERSGPWIGDRLEALQARLGRDNRVDGLVLQDNWPPNEESYDEEAMAYIPPFFNGSLSNNTIWWQARHADDPNHGTITHSAIHNAYGALQAAQTRTTLDDSSLLLSATTFPGLGRHAGALHQTVADVPAKWTSLKASLTSVLGLGLAGISLAGGGPVCGNLADYNATVHEALCLKWYLLGATLPLMRISSVAPYRDPTALSSGFTRQAVLNALHLRYTMLPYYYTAFREAALTGTPVARALFVEFPLDVYARFVDEQFLVGDALMVAPVFVPGAVNVQVYLPKDTTWYRLVGGRRVNNGTGGHVVTVSTLETEVLAMLRGGHVLPMQAAGNSSALSRANPHHLLIGLQCADVDADPCTASGRLFVGDADDADEADATLHFDATRSSLTVSNLQALQGVCERNETSATLDNVSVFGYWRDDGGVGVGVGVGVYNEVDSVLELSDLKIDLCAVPDDHFDLTW